MNYNSIYEIIESNTTHMTSLSKNIISGDYNPGIYIKVPQWLKEIENLPLSSCKYMKIFYESGIQFDSRNYYDNLHININYNNGYMAQEIYKEEGQLNKHNFFRIKWRGCDTEYGIDQDDKFEYDLIFWNNGIVSLYILSKPDDIYSDERCSIFGRYFDMEANQYINYGDGEIFYELYEPPALRYLIKDGTTGYYLKNGKVNNFFLGSVNEELFLKYGMSEIPDLSLFSNLNNPELLCWSGSEDQHINELVVITMPTKSQFIYFTSKTYNGEIINNIKTYSSDDVLLSVSLDGGVTWEYYDINQNSWITANNQGIKASDLNKIPSNIWTEHFALSSQYQFRCLLPSKDSYVGGIYIKTMD